VTYAEGVDQHLRADFLHGGGDAQIFENIREGIAGTQLAGFDMLPNEIWQLVSYIRSLSGTAARETVSGDAAVGKEIFFGKGGRAGCHQVNGRGSRFGPDLSRSAAEPPRACVRRFYTRTSEKAANAM